jgi:hypothetical protein
MSEKESNNTRATANALVPGSALEGQLSSKSDIDYYALAATYAGSISIDFDPSVNNSSYNYYKVSLLDSAGTVLARQDVGKDTKFSAGVVSAGTYYVAIEDSSLYDSGVYSLTTSMTAGSTANVEMEGNNTRSTAMDLGKTLIEMSAGFIDSDEFRASYGTNPSNGEFLTKVDNNVLGRDPDSGGCDWWVDQLTNNPEKTWEKVMVDFSEGTENQANVLELIGNGVQYDLWVA